MLNGLVIPCILAVQFVVCSDQKCTYSKCTCTADTTTVYVFVFHILSHVHRLDLLTLQRIELASNQWQWLSRRNLKRCKPARRGCRQLRRCCQKNVGLCWKSDASCGPTWCRKPLPNRWVSSRTKYARYLFIRNSCILLSVGVERSLCHETCIGIHSSVLGGGVRWRVSLALHFAGGRVAGSNVPAGGAALDRGAHLLLRLHLRTHLAPLH